MGCVKKRRKTEEYEKRNECVKEFEVKGNGKNTERNEGKVGRMNRLKRRGKRNKWIIND